MNEITLKMRKGLAIILIWVLMFNNIPMMNLQVNAQEIANREYSIDYPSNHLFSVSCGDSDWENYEYIIQEYPVGSVSCGDQLDVSGCDLPSSFRINKVNGEVVEEIINVTIKALETQIEFNDQLTNLGGRFLYGTSPKLNCSASIVSGLSEGRTITYAVTEGNDIAEISETGELTFKDGRFGTVKVKASVDATNRYASAEAEYVIEVVCENPVSLEYYKLNENSEKVEPVSAKNAYNHAVGIYPPANFDLLQSNEISNPTTIESILLSEVGVYENTVYLRNKNTGAISSKIDLGIEIDKTAPELSGVEFSQWYGVEKFNEDGSSAGYATGSYTLEKKDGSKVKLYYNDDVKMTFLFNESDLQVVAKDENNEIVNLNWEDGGKKATYTISKQSPGAHYITMQISDAAGNTYDYRSEYIFIEQSSNILRYYEINGERKYVEDQNGTVITTYTPGTNNNTRLYYDGNARVRFVIGSNAVEPILLNSYYNAVEMLFVQWNELQQNSIKWSEYRLDKEGEHRITLFDAGNGSANQTIEYIIIDQNPPIITAEHEGTCDLVLDSNGSEITLNPEYKYGEHPEYKLYYQDNAKLTFSIKEVSFDKNNVEFSDSYYVNDELRNVEWKQNGDVWTVEYPISAEDEGIHQITIKCTDKLGKRSQYTSEQIVIDNTPAQWAEPKVNYSQWLTDGTIFGAPDYPDLEGYQPGTDSNVKLYFNNDMNITFYIKKEYFNADYVKLVDRYKSDKGIESNIEIALDWERIDNSDIWKATYQIPETKLGEHVVNLVYKRINAADNDINWISEKINIIDTTLPVFSEVVYDGVSRVENQNGDVVNPEDANSINNNMKVYANKELALKFLFEEANVADIDKLKIIDTYKGVRREKSDIAWTNTVSAQKAWRTTYKVLPTEPGEHIITVEYDVATGEDITLFTSAYIFMDNSEAQLDKVIFSVSLGDSVVLEPADNTLNGDGITRYYNQNVEIDFEIDEAFFNVDDLQVSDSYYENSDKKLQYSIKSENGENHIVCFIPKTDEGTHKVTLNYLDRGYNKEVFYETSVVIDVTEPKPLVDMPIEYPAWVAAEEIISQGEEQTANKLIGAEVAPVEVLAKDKVRLFYDNTMTMAFVITEEFLDQNSVQVKDLCKQGDQNVGFRIVRIENNQWKVICEISNNQIGDHVLSISYADEAGNRGEDFTSKIICIDTTKAEPGAATYSSSIYEVKPNGGHGVPDSAITAYYKDDMTITFRIKEENFRTEDVELIDSIDGNIRTDLVWRDGRDGYKELVYPIFKADEGIHVLTLKYKDRVHTDNIINYTSKTIIMDTTAPVKGGIGYSDTVLETDEALYFREDATISFTITEENFHEEGLILEDKCNLNRNEGEEYTYTLNDEVEGSKRLHFEPSASETNVWIVTYTIPNGEYGTHNVTLKYNDPCQNGEIVFVTDTIIMDQPPSSDLELEYSLDIQNENTDENGVKNLYFNTQASDLVVTIKMCEDNFDEEKLIFTDSYQETSNIDLEWETIYEDNCAKVRAEYTITKDKEGEHVLRVIYDDPLGDEDIDFSSEILNIDSEIAEISDITYSQGMYEDAASQGGTIYYNSTTEAKVTFYIKEVRFIFKNNLEVVNAYDNKTISDIKINTKVYPVEVTCTIPNNKEGKYKLKLSYKALSNIGIVEKTTKDIVIDNTPAEKGNIQYSAWQNAEHYVEDGYGALVGTENIDDNENIVLYYKDENPDSDDDKVDVTFTVKEKYFHSEGVSVFHNGEAVADTDWTCSKVDENNYSVTYRISKADEGDHVITMTYQDRCLNGTPIEFKSKIIRIDNQKPVFSTDYDGWIEARNECDGAIIDSYEAGSRSNVRLYYNDEVTLYFEITEKHFRDRDVSFSDSYDNRVNSSVLSWERVGDSDVWTASYTILGKDEGEHIIRLGYQDCSMNSPVNHLSEHIIMDITPARLSQDSPTLSGECMWVENLEDSGAVRRYYKDDMSIVFEIEEANFYPQDVILCDSCKPDVENITIEWTPNADKTVWKGIYPIRKSESGEHIVTLRYKDRSSEEYTVNYTSEHIFMDGNRSNLDSVDYEVKWDTAEEIGSENIIEDYVSRANVDNVRLYYKNDMVITFTISEDNFHEEDVIFLDEYYEDDDISLDWERQGTSNIWKATHTISVADEGEHRLRLTYTDRSGNPGVHYVSERILMDKTVPTLDSIEVTPWKLAVNADNLETIQDYQVRQEQEQKVNLYYDDTMTMTLTITEKNFNQKDVTVWDNDVKQSVSNWQRQGDSNTWNATYTISKEKVGEHVIKLEYYDRARNTPIVYTSEKIIIDGAKPVINLKYKDSPAANRVVDDVSYYGANQQLEITIKEENFRASDVKIVVAAKDAVEAIDVDAYSTKLTDPKEWDHIDDVHKATLDFDKDAHYNITVMYKDLACLEAETKYSSIVVDNQDPIVYPLETEEAYDTASEAFKRMVDEEDNKVTAADADTRFIYDAAMTFRFAMEEINFNAADVKVLVKRDGNDLVNGDGYTYNLNEDWNTSSYVHTLTIELGERNGKVVDGDYTVVITYTDLAGRTLSTYTSNIITIDSTEPVIDIVYDNNEAKNELYYDANRVATITVMDRNVVSDEINVSITATDIDGNVVPFDLNEKQSSWEFDEETNTWSSKVTCDVDAKYDITVDCNDMADRSDTKSDSFTVDKTAPDKSDFGITYIEPEGRDSSNAYYKDSVTVTITAKDVTSPIDYFEWTYIKQPGASSINQEREEHVIHNNDSSFEYDEDTHTATAKFTLTADQARQYRGNLRFTATDMAGNTSEELTDEEQIVIVDNIDPDRTVSYSAASQVVNKDTLETITGFNYADENASAVLLYNAPMTIAFNVNEANFFAEDVVVKVNGEIKRVDNWTNAGDIWTGTLGISENGEYIVTVQYRDRSTNEMRDYVSHEIVIDTIKPQIHIAYGPNDIRQQMDGIRYYDKQQTATIKITEHNFRAEDIEVIVKATDVNGNNINITDYDGYLRRRGSWSSQGDTHTAQITFATDANYEFDIMYKDLALIPADDYPNDIFTVDQTAPTNVSVSYSSPIFEKNVQGTAYEYYNEPIVVTITAEDDISGVFGFDYSYLKAEGVSSVNSGNIANTIETSKITYSNGKKTAKAVFVIPASELRVGTQLNGTMEYVAYNKSLIPTELKDTKRYVADNVAPNVTVEYNDSVRNKNNISYYAGDIDVTVTVDEANFYAEDVKVSISKDGGELSTPNVSWRTVSVDKHVGTFTLKEEGDYKVYVSYQDPSTNKASEYQSNQLTIDLTKPNVTVSGIKYNSANNMEQIGFVVIVEDTNLDTMSFSPKLMAEIRDESGKLKQVDCTEIGTVETVVNGKSCTYTIDNIDQDGIYCFTCEVADMSENTTEDMIITDSGNKTVSKLEYSVNRNGSTYGLDENTKELNNSFITEAKDVIVYETNPDEISNIKITLFKNDKSIVLVEGKDYVVNKISEDGEWYKYEYIIYATNFLEDGTYRISIYSEDKAGNIAENNLDVKGVEINFGVDKTLPKLIVTNLEDKTTYPLDKLSVLMQATDNMKLVNITVELDGKVVASWDEEQIQQMSSNLQDFVFDILGNSTQAHTVTITLKDIAGNEYIETISNFYVTRNLWVRFINNKLLFYGSIVACLTAGFSFILLWKRRKKRKEARE